MNFMKNGTRIALFLFGLTLILGPSSLAFPAVRAAPQGTVAPEYITTDTTWTEAGSPYRVDVRVIVMPGATLTMEPGVVVESANNVITPYSFEVMGRLKAQGTAAKPIRFCNSAEGWSGLQIVGSEAAPSLGSILEHVILDGGGSSGAGIGGNLVLAYGDVTVRHSQFNNSPGDGILVNWSGVLDVANASFGNNAGYAINFKDGSANPVLANLAAGGNGPELPYGGNFVAITGQGQLSGAHTWEKTGLPYLIDAQVTTLPGSTLTIQPGVTVYVAPGNDNLNVQGRIVANGTAEQQIRFLAADQAAGWAGLQLLGPAAQPVSDQLFNHVLMKRGGFGNACNLYLEHGAATVSNSQFSESADSGVCLGTGAALAMTDSQLNGNGRYAIELYDPNAGLTLSGLSATGNQSNAIGVWGGTLTTNRVWPWSGINDYHLMAANLLISGEGTLALAPGIRVRLEYGREIIVQGALTAVGNADHPIRITGWENAPGYWGGLKFHGSAVKPAFGRFTYVTVEYGGYGGSAMVELQDADVIFKYCTLRHSSGDAVLILPGTAAGHRPAGLEGAPALQIGRSGLYALGAYAINNESDLLVQAAYNWWGAASGPMAAGNPGGTGSALYGPVQFQPYLISPDSRFVYLPLVVR
jgi:hypothetical protein